MKTKRVLISSTLAGALLVFSQGTYAAPLTQVDQPNKVDYIVPNIQSEESEDQITLEWDLEGNIFAVYRDDEKVWEGKDSIFVDSHLDSGMLYKYRIVSLNEDMEITNFINVSTKTLKQSDNIQLFSKNEESDSLLEGYEVQSISGIDFVKLDWNEMPDEDGLYQIYRDGDFLTSTSLSEFVDITVDPGMTYRYNIIANKKVDESKIQEIQAEANAYGLTIPEDSDLFYDNFELIKFVDTADRNVLESPADSFALMADTTYFSFRYMTFIPPYKVANPFRSGTYFLGNNRSFNYLSSSYKTQTNADIDFTGNTVSQKLGFRRSVGTTYLVDANNNILDYRTASINGMKIEPNGIRDTQRLIEFKVSHDVGLPFYDEISPDITYTYFADAYRNGNWTVSGAHDKAPAHEFYVYRNSTQSYATIFQHTFDGNFNHLFPTAASWHFNVSG